MQTCIAHATGDDILKEATAEMPALRKERMPKQPGVFVPASGLTAVQELARLLGLSDVAVEEVD